MVSVDNLTGQFASKLEITPNERFTSYSKQKEYVSLAEVEKSISVFDGCNMEASSFIDECEAAYRLIDPINVPHLSAVIYYSKISGKAISVLRHVEIRFHSIILELKRKYIHPEQLDWIYELIITKQELYENPIQFGKRLQTMIDYAKETYRIILPRTLANHQMISVKNTALRIFLTKMSNKKLEKKVTEENPETLTEAIEIAEKKYEFMNLTYSICSTELWQNKSGKCSHCEDNEYHYFDCLLEK